MPMHRKNKSRAGKRQRGQNEQPWFRKNVQRQRARSLLARIARRKNRRREKGK